MNITLIRPPAYSSGLMGAQLVPFLGIAYIGAAAREAGHRVDIVDMCGEDITRTEIIRGRYAAYGMSFSVLGSRIKQSEVIGFTCMFSQDWIFHRELIQYVRKLYPESILVAGGEHVSSLPEYCLMDCRELDICVIGEGEEVFVRLLDVLGKKGNLSDVPGLVYRSGKEGVYHSTPRAGRIREIDKIPLPAWDLTPLENYLSRELNYHIRRGRTIPMLATRGCPYRCTFCSNSNMWGNPWIARDPELVADEMEYYIEHYKAANFVFSDLTAVVSREGIVNSCNEILNRRIDRTWQLPTLRTEAIDSDVLKLMYRAGCRELDVAIESGSKDVLESVNKRNNPEKMVLLIKNGVGIGMNLSSNIVLGLPKEGLKEFLKTYWLVVKLAWTGLQEVNVFPFIPYPGSELFRDFLEDEKIKLNDGYFLSLFGYADIARATSWSERFGPRTLSFMRLFLMFNFYGLMFISHPKRIVQLLVNAGRGRTTTKLEGVLGRVFKNVRVYFPHRARHAG
ncbi:MAG: B12-binding domain-containing radical SAM protein [Candidatus Omnitrophica bacterium]|nr:B12-binding domain-containing radical SAM protein [Candidatus Omnitrophota bacterium]